MDDKQTDKWRAEASRATLADGTSAPGKVAEAIEAFLKVGSAGLLRNAELDDVAARLINIWQVESGKDK